MQLKPGFLSRGHGGSFADAACRRRASRQRPACRRRAAAAGRACAGRGDAEPRRRRPAAAVERGCDFLIMDDGFQSARIHMDYALAGGRRPPRRRQRPCHSRRPAARAAGRPAALCRRRAQDGRGRRRPTTIVRQASRAGRPVFEALDAAARARAFRRPALSGLRRHRPSRTSSSRRCAQAGGTVAMARSFPDHHFYSPATNSTTGSTAEARPRLELVTTAKDAARLRHGTAPAEFFARTERAGDRCGVRERATPRSASSTRRCEAWRDRRHRPDASSRTAACAAPGLASISRFSEAAALR